MDSDKNNMTAGIIEDVLRSMGVEGAKVDVSAVSDGGKESSLFSITVDRKDSKILIGQHGVGLFSFQHLIQTIIRRKTGASPDFSVDVNRYWREKRSLLRRDAEEAARDAVATGRPVSMRPMLPYERKIVHAALSENARVETGSIGKGEDRKVVVKPKAVFS
ncbi:MAG TPA: R3H domain-containing nucleic acid-binding protein [Candidatus Fimivivens sp.]|nr:R3H domain-containing nucleic acid-binding protein [Candidatus Fimivivens sp.]